MKYVSFDTQAEATAEDALDNEGELLPGFQALEDSYFAMIFPDAATVENKWAKKEIEWACIEINKHEHGHSRTVSDVATLKTYCNNCRDLVIDGVIQGSRPTRPE